MEAAVKKKDIRKLTLEQLEDYFSSIGEKSFRAKQVYEWLWKKGARSFEGMTNLSKSLRDRIEQDFTINHIAVDQMQRSSDGTIKNAVKLFDGLTVESVLIPTETRITACVSSQVGCSLDCNFCATARLKRMRNLNPDEIYDQVVTIMQQGSEFFDRPLTNIVFMGMGEPLLNYNNVLQAIDMITSPEGLNMSPRRITLSTVGIPKMITRMADEDVKFNLAVSLHSAINEKRSALMPINEKSNLEDLLEALQYWYSKTKKRITFEYVVWRGINDKPEDVKALVEYCKKVPSKVNLIEYNPIDEGEYQQASQESLNLYIKLLEANNIIVNVRHSRGKDIDAACGQLANKNG
ncbi:MAG: 23S rRNA (adenine(2503)-C(2))-methyltransferase RlmN [Candidatus Cyclobacteriaceae bacterium M2_1C_046]